MIVGGTDADGWMDRWREVNGRRGGRIDGTDGWTDACFTSIV